MSLKEYVKTEILKKIIHDENGVKYIKEVDLDNLSLDVQEKKFVLELLKEEEIEVKPTLITQKDRPKTVRDYNYGDIASNELELIDMPIKATITFDKFGNIIYEDYSELEKFLDKEIVSKYTKSTRNDFAEPKFEQTVQFNMLVKLGLSELELMHAFRYLGGLNIKIVGISPDVDADLNIENYNYIRTFKESEKELFEASKNDEERIAQYQQNKDVLLRNEILKNNLRLVSFVAYKYSIITGINIHELESFGYEGLIYATEKFNTNKGCRFSTYAVPCIRGFILRGIPKIQGFKNNDFYYNFIACKKVVEDFNCVTIEECPELLKDVFELLVETGKFRSNNYYDFVKMISICKPLFKENMNEYESDYNMEDEIIEQISNEELLEIIENIPSITDRNKEIFKYIYGLIDGKQRTKKEVAEIFGLSPSRISGIENKCIYRIRQECRIRRYKI